MIVAYASITFIILTCIFTFCYVFKCVNPPKILEYKPTENDSISMNFVQIEPKLAYLRSYTSSPKQNDFRVFEEV